MRFYRVDSHRVRAIGAGLALVALTALPAAAEEKQPFDLVNFGVPIVTTQPAAAAEPAAAAQAPAAGALSFFESTELGGLLDTYYDYYSTKQNGLYRNFDTAHNQFTFNMGEVWLTKAPTADSRTGFKFKLNFGPAATAIHFAEGASIGVFQNIQEGYVSYLAPAGKGLQFDFGKFVTPHGAEVIEAKDNWNYSRSILFAFAIPYYHVGLRVTYPVSDRVMLMGGLINGWNNVIENNTGKTVMGMIMLKPVPKVSINNVYMGGPEQAGNNKDWRHLSDTVFSYTITPSVSVMANYDYGHETVAGDDVHWQGVAAYLKYQANKWVAVIPRGEYYDDPQGYTTGGTAQKLKEFTLTFELKPTDNFQWRIEYRGDFSDVATFTNDDGAKKKNQHSIGFGLLYNFSTKQ